MSAITTHVLDLGRGRPADGIAVTLEAMSAGGHWKQVGNATTNADGRAGPLLPAGEKIAAGAYRLSFDTGAYFKAKAVQGFYPSVTVTFEVTNPGEHHHVPVLLSPFGYSTYRGS